MSISLTENAANKIIEIAKQEKKSTFGLRIHVFPGGCAGFQYGLDFEEKPHDTDKVFKKHGVQLFVDKESIDFLKGAKIDYINSLQESGFKIDNPNVVNSCNCGKSVC